MRLPWMTVGTCLAAAVAIGGCHGALDQDRPQHAVPPSRPAATLPVATGERGQPQPLPGLVPPPKPFIALGDKRPAGAPAQPSPLLLEHAAPDTALSAYGRQPTYAVADFQLDSKLTGVAVQKRLGPPAGVAGIDDRWLVYRLTFGRELWLNFATGDGPLLAADVISGAENGYVRNRVYPTR